jgi:hypothetical protein
MSNNSLSGTRIRLAMTQSARAALIVLTAACMVTLLTLRAAADPSDLVPQGSVLLDAFAHLAGGGYLGPNYTSRDFYTATRYTDEELAQILEDNCLQDQDRLDKLQSSAWFSPALVKAVDLLEPEIKADGFDIQDLLDVTHKWSSAVNGYVQPEYRVQNAAAPFSDPKSVAIYRVTAIGDLGSNSGYSVSGSNWADDYRQFFDNYVGPQDFTALNEAYLNWRGRNGLTFDLGRMYDQWGPGYIGATVLSDNAPALDQARIRFPFSLGRRLGREYTLTQNAATFDEGGQEKYFVGRRIEYRFSSQWNTEFEEAVKSDSSGTFLLTPFPFEVKSSNFSHVLPGVHIQSNDPESKYFIDFGATYSPLTTARFYGQFQIDDMKSPLGSPNKVVPRKIGYILGTALKPARGTNLVFEYAYADPTAYTYHTNQSEWTNGTLDYLGLPSGPNSRDYYARVDQKITDRLTVTVDYTVRDRKSDSFPEPDASHTEASTTYSLGRATWGGLAYQYFHEDPFPIAPDSPAYPIPFQTPVDEGNQGVYARVQEWDITYGPSF